MITRCTHTQNSQTRGAGMIKILVGTKLVVGKLPPPLNLIGILGSINVSIYLGPVPGVPASPTGLQTFQ